MAVAVAQWAHPHYEVHKDALILLPGERPFHVLRHLLLKPPRGLVPLDMYGALRACGYAVAAPYANALLDHGDIAYVYGVGRADEGAFSAGGASRGVHPGRGVRMLGELPLTARA